MAEVIKDLINAGVGMATAEKKEKNAAARAKAANDEYWARIDAANWEPEYASQHAPKFQKSSSPVARAYLESFLTGTNPAMVQGTALGADEAKATATQDFNQRYGGWDKIQAKQNAYANDNSRYAVTPITRQVRDESRETGIKHPWLAQYEEKLGRTFSPEEAEDLAKIRTGGKKDIAGRPIIDTEIRLGMDKEKLERYLASKGLK
jgi:hypothetical protein